MLRLEGATVPLWYHASHTPINGATAVDTPVIGARYTC